MQVKGRYLVIGWTTVFLAAAGTIVLRVRRGTVLQARLHEVRDSVQAMRATRDRIVGTISALESRSVLIPRMEQLGYREPSDSEVIHLHLPPDR